MGQYFKAINTKKKELVCPWCIGGRAKLWEWATNPQRAVFTLLLRRSSATGGGDFGGLGQQFVNMDDSNDFGETLAKVLAREGQKMPVPETSVVGRWAGDPVYLIGDYDESELYFKAESYRNISQELAETWNQFIELDDHQLEFDPCSGCKNQFEEGSAKQSNNN